MSIIIALGLCGAEHTVEERESYSFYFRIVLFPKFVTFFI